MNDAERISTRISPTERFTKNILAHINPTLFTWEPNLAWLAYWLVHTNSDIVMLDQATVPTQTRDHIEQERPIVYLIHITLRSSTPS